MPSESDKWGWKHVSVFGGFDKGSGTKRWKCNHCNIRYNGSYSRVRAHLLGFAGAGIKSCPEIDRSLREALQILDKERLARRKRRSLGVGKPSKRIRATRQNLSDVTKEDVDEVVARFFIADGLNLIGVTSPYFREIVKAIASFGPGYEPPSIELFNSFLSKEKGKIEKSVALFRESWPRTGCTVLCIGRVDATLRYFCISIFVSSPRGLIFLKAVHIEDIEELDNVLTGVLSDVITEVGPMNVLQIISHLGRANKYSEALILTKFPHIFWSPCTTDSIRMLMEEIAELDWIKPVGLRAKEIEQCIITYQSSQCMLIQNLKGNVDPLFSKLSPSYAIVQRVFELKQPLQEVVVSEGWKEWKLRIADNIASVEASILGNDFWSSAHLFSQLCEPFLRSFSVRDVEKFLVGDVCDWRVQALEALNSKGIDEYALNQLEQLIESRWDVFFSPLHAAGYLLNPIYFGKGQIKDKTVMRGWKATLERYESDSVARRVLREQLSSYLHADGSLGDEDAIDCRDKIDPVAWWENFGFETPELQTLAIKILSQVSSIALCQELWQDNDFQYAETVNRFGVERVDDLVFVRNNLRLSVLRNTISISPGQKILNSGSSSGFKTFEIAHFERANEMVNVTENL